MNNCYSELPEGYQEVFRVNAADKKTGLILNLVATGIMIVVIALVIVLGVFLGKGWELTLFGSLWYLVGFIILNVAYVIMHESVHGVVYKVMTKQKLTYGFKLSYAYCGVPNVYVSRKTALCSLCAPLVVFSVLFVALAVVGFFFDPYLYFLFGVLFAIHIGGCAGDMYDIFLYITRFKDKATLMRDTGAEQTFYQK